MVKKMIVNFENLKSVFLLKDLYIFWLFIIFVGHLEKTEQIK